MSEREITLPATFYLDHVARDLPGGVILKETKRQVTVRLTETVEAELRLDALYYSTDAKYMGSEFAGLGRSAAATLRALDA